jgi:glycosyltransferase involved in cell wall biosynthesis
VISDPAVTVIGETEAAGAEFIAHGRGLDKLPSIHIEAMMMSAAAENLSWVAAGWAPPAPGRYGPSGVVLRDPEIPESAHLLLRRPIAAMRRRAPVVGRVLPHITSAESCDGLTPIAEYAVASGAYRIHPEKAGEAVVESPWFPVDEVLAGLPSIGGPPTVLFLLPFLAVGGAERLLYELMEGLGDRYRVLIATTDPHLESFGQTVDRARQLTPHVYTLGDWLPREAMPSAIRHLIRRWAVETLVCWNGSVLFYDEVANLRRTFPELRIVNQLFNHEGGWIEHTTPSLIQAVDAQIAVNTPIARALVEDRGVPDDRVITIHHAVGPPEPRDEDRRARLRRELGVDDDTVVVGTFIRMHRQKRPLDIIELARRMNDDKIHFFLVGGGPLDDAVNREIARNRPPNLTRWPLQADATPLYDAIDLCLMTSDFEGLPVFLLDGLARGIPCVATAVGDIPLLLRDGGGRVVERPGDLDGLADAIRPYLDPNYRRAEGEKGRTAVETRFGLDRYVAAYEAAIFRPRRGERK